jgi:hypothetical protein
MTTPPPAAAPAPAADVPGKTLGIVALVLAFLAAPIGAILGFVAKAQSKPAGFKNTPATAAIIIGIILTVLWIVIVVGSVIAGAALVSSACAGLEPGVYDTGNGGTITCG